MTTYSKRKRLQDALDGLRVARKNRYSGPLLDELILFGEQRQYELHNLTDAELETLEAWDAHYSNGGVAVTDVAHRNSIEYRC